MKNVFIATEYVENLRLGFNDTGPSDENVDYVRHSFSIQKNQCGAEAND